VRWADAAFQSGRPREAAEALDRALLALRARGDTEATARALQLRSRLSQRLGEGTQIALAAEAVSLLEHEPPGAALVAAYEQLANVHMVAGAYTQTIAVADRASELVAALGLAEPARALGYRGFARAYLGDGDGLAEMEQALAVLEHRGAGRDVGILQNNLAIARYPLDGPEGSLAVVSRGIEFCAQRGLQEVAAQLEANVPGLLAELGRVDEALRSATHLIATLRTRGDLYTEVEVRAVELACSVARGEHAGGVDPWLVERARTIGTVDIQVTVFAAAAAASLADGSPSQAREHLAELADVEGIRGASYYARALPGAMRTALAAGDPALAKRLADGVEPRYPLNEHALRASTALLAEHERDQTDAATLYADAASRWHEFGNVPERAYALLGHGRCLLALGRADAGEPLREARHLFESMGYAPALAETETLLERATVAEVP
jgi:tetratricopeptide (TPR) repeat protein